MTFLFYFFYATPPYHTPHNTRAAEGRDGTGRTALPVPPPPQEAHGGTRGSPAGPRGTLFPVMPREQRQPRARHECGQPIAARPRRAPSAANVVFAESSRRCCWRRRHIGRDEPALARSPLALARPPPCCIWRTIWRVSVCGTGTPGGRARPAEGSRGEGAATWRRPLPHGGERLTPPPLSPAPPSVCPQ